MKKLLLVFATAFAFSAFSQPVFGPEGATWYFTTSNIGGSSLLKYEVAGYDTLDGLPAVFMYQFDSVSGNPISEYSLIAHADSNRLFFHDGESFKLFSDFSAQVGDTLYPQFKHWIYIDKNMQECPDARIIVTETGTMDINGMSLRYYEYQMIDEEFYSWEFWGGRFIERIIGMGDVWGYPGCCGGCTSISGMVCYTDFEFGDYHPFSDSVCDYFIGVAEPDTGRVEFNVFPNPVSGSTLTFSLFDGMIVPNHSVINLTDLQGRIVRTIALSGAEVAGGKVQVDLSGLASGVYVAHWMDGGRWMDSVKIVVE